jgi:hypothetical protein
MITARNKVTTATASNNNGYSSPATKKVKFTATASEGRHKTTSSSSTNKSTNTATADSTPSPSGEPSSSTTAAMFLSVEKHLKRSDLDDFKIVGQAVNELVSSGNGAYHDRYRRGDMTSEF